MNETVDPTGLKLHDALRAIQQATAFEVPLRRRTEGLTWMLWGLVTAGIILSYDAMTPHFYAFDHATGEETSAPWYIDILWVYWVAAGSLATWALWRTASLALRVDHKPAGLRVTLLWVLAGALGWAIVLLAVPGTHPHLVPALAVGIAWLTLGALDLQRTTSFGRLVLVTVGTLIVVSALLVDTLVGPGPEHDLFAIDLGRLLAAALPPFVLGLWQALRG